MIGQKVSHYRITEKLGEGGMGEVFLADDTELKRQVALKFMSSEYASDPDFVARFKREAQAAAALNHPNIVTIHQVGQHAGRPFIAMAYVDGHSLSETVVAGDRSIETAFGVVGQCCEGLARAHEAGVIHRDVKPDNILVDNDGRVKILDFGLAKLKGASKDSGTHSTLGTIYYMSPEQARGDVIDNRSDIFSLGAVLYELLTGRSPFKREHSAAVLYSIANEDPQPPSAWNPSISPEIDRIVAKALAKKVEDRYASAMEFGEDLRAVLDGEKPAVARRGVRWLRILLPTSVVFAVVAALVMFKPFSIEFSSERGAEASQNSLAIMYFDNVVDPEDPHRLGEIATNLLITDLSESEYMEVVSSQRLYDILKLQGREGDKVIDRDTASEIARLAGAKWMLLGSILQTEPSLIMTSRLIDVERGNVIASQRITGADDERIFSLVDRLTDEIKSDLALPAGATDERDMPIAEATTHSTDAYRCYLDGEESRNKYYARNARDNFQRAIKLDSTMAMAYLGLASANVEGSGQEKKWAIKQALRYADHASKRERCYIRSADARLSGDVDRAIHELDQLLVEFPNEKDAYKALGELYRLFKRDPKKSIAAYRKAIAIDPLDKSSYNILAYTYQAQGDIDNYVWAIYQYMSLAPDEANPYDSRGDLYAFSGKIDKAIMSYSQALERKPDFYASLRKIGHMYLFKGEYDDARSHYSQLLASDDAESRSVGRHLLALVPARQGKIDRAIDVIRDGIAADVAEGYEGRAYYDKFTFLAHLYSERDEATLALGALDEAAVGYARLNPDDPVADLDDRALILARLGEFERAESVLARLASRVKTLMPNAMPFYWRIRGYCELEKGDAAAAVESLEKGAHNDPAFYARFPLALAYLKADRPYDAANEFEKIVRRYSEDRAYSPIWSARMFYYFGIACEMVDRPRKAIEQYENFLDIWKGADARLMEVQDAEARLAHLPRS